MVLALLFSFLHYLPFSFTYDDPCVLMVIFESHLIPEPQWDTFDYYRDSYLHTTSSCL